MPFDGVTIIPNRWLRDPRASGKAKGYLAYILSHAADYVLRMEQFVAEMADGKDAVRTGLAELERLGYLTRSRQRDDAGHLGPYEYVLADPFQGGESDPAQERISRSGPDQAEQGVSPGQNQSGFSAPGNPPTKKNTPREINKKNIPPSLRSVPPTPRATRIPDGWTPDPSLRSWTAETLTGSGINANVELEKFRDYWAAKAGADARKVSWDATWRNWIRKALERAPGAPGTAVAVRGSAANTGAAARVLQRATDRASEWDALVNMYREA